MNSVFGYIFLTVCIVGVFIALISFVKSVVELVRKKKRLKEENNNKE